MDAPNFELLRDEIARDEGVGPGGLGRVYIDTEGVPTIGRGYNIAEPSHRDRLTELGYDAAAVVSGSATIGEEHVELLFRESIRDAIASVKAIVPNFDTLPGVVQRVLVNMAFNVGQRRLSGFKQMLLAVNHGDFRAAADEMVDSRWYGQVGQRSKRLVELMRQA